MSCKGHTVEIRAMPQQYGTSELSGIDSANYKALLNDVKKLNHV